MLTNNLMARADIRWVLNTHGTGDTNQGIYTGGLSWLFDVPSYFDKGAGQKDSSKAAMTAGGPLKTAEEHGISKPASAGTLADAGHQLDKDKHASINLDVQFDANKAAIKPQYTSKLMDFARFLNEHPKAIAEIQGHTDSAGKKKHNIDLSAKRAEAVKHILITKGNVTASRLTAKGYGPSEPVADNGTAKGRMQNWRVVAVVKMGS